MPTIVIDGVTINFPYKPYEVQVKYMAKVIQCLNKGQNGMLESPTGTGKTLSLLCSVLAWVLKYRREHPQPEQIELDQPDQNELDQAEQNESYSKRLKIAASEDFKVPLIIYASRTHSQIRQAMQEMKKTSYRFMHAVALGSRDQLCINPNVQSESDNVSKNIACDSHVQKGRCKFYKRNLKAHSTNLDSILDIEDLVKFGKTRSACPYFATKHLAKNADVIFMPYNYLFDPKIRKSVGIPLRDAIVIIDEAHNIDTVCEDAASVDLRSSEIAAHIKNLAMVTELQLTSSQSENNLVKMMRKHLLRFKAMLIDLNSAISKVELKSKGSGEVFPGAFIFKLLEQAHITKEHFWEISNTMEKTLSMLKIVLEIQDEELKTYSCSESEKREDKRMNISLHNATRSLTIFHDNLMTIFDQRNADIETEVDRCFRVFVEFEKVNGVATKTKVVHFWCFNPGHGMAQILKLGIHSIILTSGTITPFQPLQAELNMPVSIFLANQHVIQKSHVYVKAIPKGPDNGNLISNYQNRGETAYLDSMGLTILKLCSTLPDGLLVFFSSYLVMNTCIQHWRNSKVWDDINSIKTIFVEPREKDAFTETMTAYYENIQDTNKKGACFMAVCRGKVSEGLDFADKNGRAVIITGLPFPPMKDMKVILKKDYLENNRSLKNQLPSSDQWYDWQAMRAVNQAIGRIIRHRNDYGAILLCDSRFTSDKYRKQLSKWVQGYMESQRFESNFDNHIKEFSNFFEQHAKEEIVSVTAEVMGPSLSRLSGTMSSYDEYFEELSEADMTAIADQLQEADRIIGRNSFKTKNDLDKILPHETSSTFAK